MKKEIPPFLMYGVVAAIVLVLGLVVWAQNRPAPQLQSEDLPPEFFEDPDPPRFTQPEDGVPRRRPN